MKDVYDLDSVSVKSQLKIPIDSVDYEDISGLPVYPFAKFFWQKCLSAAHNSHYCTCLGHLVRCNIDRIISIGQGM
jgi:hypothetical protein